MTPRPVRVDTESIVEALTAARAPLTPAELAERLAIGADDRGAFNTELENLERAGRIVRNRAGLLLVAARANLLSGQVQGHRDGFGFLIRVRVRDNGIGIGPEHLSEIFDPFYRVKDERAAQTGGAGLGLAIVKHTVDAHGGDIHVESVVGRGWPRRSLARQPMGRLAKPEEIAPMVVFLARRVGARDRERLFGDGGMTI